MNHGSKTHQPTFTRMRRIFYLACLAAGPGLAALSASPQAHAQDGGSCSNATLKGEYAEYVSGVRSFGGVIENFVAVALRKYDGNGNFTEEWGSFHGALTGVQESPSPLTGTYVVNPNCTGTTTLNLPAFLNAPPIVSDLVIMDNAKEVREIVMSPFTNVVSAVSKRVW